MRRSADECVPSGFAEKRERRGRLPFAVRLNRESARFFAPVDSEATARLQLAYEKKEPVPLSGNAIRTPDLMRMICANALQNARETLQFTSENLNFL